MGILSTLLLTPLLGIAVLAVIPNSNPSQIRFISILFSIVVLLFSCWLAFDYNQQHGGIQYRELYTNNIHPSVTFVLGIDGLSMPVVLLVSILFLIALLVSSEKVLNVKAYYMYIMLLELLSIGALLVLDWYIFFLFLILTLIVLTVVVAKCGYGKQRNGFAFYTASCSFFILFSLLLISQVTHDNEHLLMYSTTEIVQRLSPEMQFLVLSGFVIGLGVMVPIFPFHIWLKLVLSELPGSLSILLVGIISKIGLYGLIKAISMLPEAALILQPYLYYCALFGIVCGGLLAIKKQDLISTIAYWSTSYLNIAFLAIVTLNSNGITGSILYMFVHGVGVSAMLLLNDLINKHLQNGLVVGDFVPIVKNLPQIAFFWVILLLTVIGFPGTIGFTPLYFLMVAAYHEWGYGVVIIGLCLLVSAIFALRMLTVLCIEFIKIRPKSVLDIKIPGLFVMYVLLALILVMSLWPTLIINLSVATINELTTVIVQY